MSQPQSPPLSCAVLVTTLCPPPPRSLPCQPGLLPVPGNGWLQLWGGSYCPFASSLPPLSSVSSLHCVPWVPGGHVQYLQDAESPHRLLGETEAASLSGHAAGRGTIFSMRMGVGARERPRCKCWLASPAGKRASASSLPPGKRAPGCVVRMK